MAKEINLTSQKWNDIIFEGKNKDYGAYDMRKSSSKRHIVALLVILAFAVFVSFLPLIVESIAAAGGTENISESNVLAELKQLEDQVKEKDIIREAAAEPPPVLKSTIQFTVPEIVDKKDIKDDEEMKAQDELASTTTQISVATVHGEEHGVDIADLQDHKVIAEVKDDIFDFVEQMPVYPGGDKELNKFLSKNIVYPEIASSNRIQGKVRVKFVVGTTGEVTDVEISKGVDRSLNAEAIRVVKSMKKWIPGKQNGQPVKVRCEVQIVFALQD